MKDKFKLRIIGAVLLLIYAFSITPAIVFHHHHSQVSFNDANQCEKAIYFGITDEHAEHIGQYNSKCWFCDTHTISQLVIFDNARSLKQSTFCILNNSVRTNYHIEILKDSLNKDPPQLI